MCLFTLVRDSGWGDIYENIYMSARVKGKADEVGFGGEKLDWSCDLDRPQYQMFASSLLPFF